MNRAERRRRARRGEPIPVLIAGDGIVAAALGHPYEAKPHAELPAKIAGQHRWVATGAWVLNSLQIRSISDPDTRKFLDNENLLALAVGCWDCEQPLGAIEVDSRCPAEAGS